MEDKEKKRKTRSPARRLDRMDWIRAAERRLVDHGAEGVRVEALAKHLGVTKGSFYWHFKDRSALLDALLDDWRTRFTLHLIERLEASGESPVGRLHALMTLRSSGERPELDARIELAIRLWARTDPRARRALEEIDELRLQYFSGLFVALGHPQPLARTKAILAYSYMRVAASLLYTQSPGDLDAVEQLLLS